jgi:hypothetical protein
MCQRINCKRCGKPTYAGCGRHIEAVLGDVPQAARCRCRETSEAGQAGAGKPQSWISSVLGGLGRRRA